MIEVKNLSYTYPKAEQPALRRVDFEIARGEIFGFLGPSGAGKSTTQKILYKVLPDYRGEIEIGGRPLDSWGKEYFERIGVGFELPNHYLKLTARENLELFASFYPSGKIGDLEPLFEIVGLAENRDQRVEEFSKGMKMRLNYIRAIMHDPEILFFDEPTIGLDPINQQKIKRHIRQLRDREKTVFIATHDMTTAGEICDRVAFIVDGELRLTENPAILKNRYGKQNILVELKNGRSDEFPVEGLGKNREFLEFIRSGEVHRINTQEATLEEVFIRVTGQQLQ